MAESPLPQKTKKRENKGFFLGLCMGLCMGLCSKKWSICPKWKNKKTKI